MKRIVTFIFLIVLFISAINAEGIKKHKRFGIDLKASFTNSAGVSQSVSVGGINVDTDVNGISGKILFNYYINDNYTFFVSAGMISSDNDVVVDFSNVGTESNVVTPIYFGAKYYIIKLSDEESILKPYVNGGIGVALGIQNKSEILNVSSSVESTPAAYIGAGADLLLTQLFKLTFDVGYNLINDFKNPIGTTKDFSGAEISFGVGFSF